MKSVFAKAIAALGLATLLVSSSTVAVAKPVISAEKPIMYSYQSILTMPRAQWADMDKAYGARRAVLDRAIADHTLIAYGNDSNLFHTADGWTHVDWWAGSSLAAVFKVLDEMKKSGVTDTPVLATAMTQIDGAYLSRYYNWRAGSYEGLFTHVGIYKLKSDAPADAMDTLSKKAIMPLLEPLVASGAIVQYEIDEEAFATGSGAFFISFMARTPEEMMKTTAALAAMFKSHPAGSMVDFTAYRDAYSRTDKAVYR
ncbi:MAG: hypothetical protein ABI395_10560 [Sphingobium sp.]